MHRIRKLKTGDCVAILSPSFAAPGRWPEIYSLGIERLVSEFGLVPVEYPTTRQIGASNQSKSKDLIEAFTDPKIKGVISSFGGFDQVQYVNSLPREPFMDNPKLFLGYSDNSHFMNFLWNCGVPSFYGGSVMNQFAMPGGIDKLTVRYLMYSLFENGFREIVPSDFFTDIDNDWGADLKTYTKGEYEINDGWYWDGNQDVEGISWGGCLESINEMLEYKSTLPDIHKFSEIILIIETSEEIPSHSFVESVLTKLGNLGVFSNLKGVVVGRPKAWSIDKRRSFKQKELYRLKQREVIKTTIRKFNENLTLIQNVDFGHTDPQIVVPYGKLFKLVTTDKRISAYY